MGQWSKWYPLNAETIDKYASDEPGVYKIRLIGDYYYDYPKKQSQIIYIGESHDRTILIRLKEHISGNNGNEKVYAHYEKYKLKFCEICSDSPYDTEQNALDKFSEDYGDMPICNER